MLEIHQLYLYSLTVTPAFKEIHIEVEADAKLASRD